MQTTWASGQLERVVDPYAIPTLSAPMLLLLIVLIALSATCARLRLA